MWNRSAIPNLVTDRNGLASYQFREVILQNRINLQILQSNAHLFKETGLNLLIKLPGKTEILYVHG